MNRIIVPLLVLFSIIYIINFVRCFIENEKEKIQIYYDEEWNPYDIWDDEL